MTFAERLAQSRELYRAGLDRTVGLMLRERVARGEPMIRGAADMASYNLGLYHARYL